MNIPKIKIKGRGKKPIMNNHMNKSMPKIIYVRVRVLFSSLLLCRIIELECVVNLHDNSALKLKQYRKWSYSAAAASVQT